MNNEDEIFYITGVNIPSVEHGLFLNIKERHYGGYYNTSGELVIPYFYNYEFYPFFDGVSIGTDENGKRFVYNTKGKRLFDTEYDWILHYSEGVAFASKNKNGLIGVIDKSGNVIIDFRFETAHRFRNGLAMVKEGGREFIIDIKGNEIKDYFRPKLNKGIWLKYEQGLIGDLLFFNGLAVAVKNGKFGYINKNSEIVIDFIFDDALNFINGYAKVCINDKWGLIDTSGKLIVDCKYKELGYVMEDTVAFKRSGKWGFLDLKGNIMIPNIYANVSHFNDGYAGVSLNRKLFLIDRNGNPLKRKNG